MKQIVVNGVSKVYHAGKANAFFALKKVHLEVEKGEVVILKGVSGSGKSTLLSLIGGLSKPTEGEILVEGHNIAKLPDVMSSSYRHKSVGFIFQSFNLLAGLTVYQNVMAPLGLTQLGGAEIEERIHWALGVACIDHKKHQKVGELSGGERQRCAIARAIVMNPAMILADEPTANLDAQNSLAFVEILKSFKQMGKSVLIATHDPLFDEVEEVDRSLMMRNGEILL